MTPSEDQTRGVEVADPAVLWADSPTVTHASARYLARGRAAPEDRARSTEQATIAP
jgi:hypothetical protein